MFSYQHIKNRVFLYKNPCLNVFRGEIRNSELGLKKSGEKGKGDGAPERQKCVV